MQFIIPIKPNKYNSVHYIRVSILDYGALSDPVVFSYETDTRVVKTVHIPLWAILFFWERVERLIRRIDEAPQA